MSIDNKKRRERLLAFIVVILLIIFAIIEYRLVSLIRPLPKYSNVLIFAVININLLLILILSFLVIRNLVKLLFEEKIHLIGAKLKGKLTLAFIIISLLPTILLFFISFQFLQTSLAYWFDVKIERSLEQAISIGRIFYKDKVNQLKTIEEVLSNQISLRCQLTQINSLDIECISGILNPASIGGPTISCIKRLPINVIQVRDPDGRILWEKTWLPLTDKVPSISINNLRGQGHRAETVYSKEVDSGILLMVAAPISYQGKGVAGYLVVGRLLQNDIVSELEAVRQGFEEYKQLKIFQTPLKTSLLSTLFLITLLIIFVSIWFALKFAKSITEPVQMLSDATHRVAQGDLNFHLEIKGRDELSDLVRAFNTMTKDLKEARRRAEEASRRLLKSYSELEHRKAYIEMLLENITAGVISLDKRGKVTTINKSACNILDIDPNMVLGKDYRTLLSSDELTDLENVPQELMGSPGGTVKKSVRINIGQESRSLLINFSLLKDKDDNVSGILIVFDDLTELERIQRLAAWRDVARRIAHEIKNPLTPIKLSAQRLRRKISGHLEGPEQEVFDRCTNTIIAQTDELKKLVDEFSRFARMPAPVLKKVDIAPLIYEVSDIYKGMIHIDVDIPEDFPRLMMDSEQIKRVLINIIDNSISAGKASRIHISAYHNKNTATITIADNGIGMNKKDISKVFDPYFSRKKGGTGLGLAIVKSIIDAHNAKISLELNKPSGVIFYINFKLDL